MDTEKVIGHFLLVAVGDLIVFCCCRRLALIYPFALPTLNDQLARFLCASDEWQVLTKDEARRIAANIAKLPELVRR